MEVKVYICILEGLLLMMEMLIPLHLEVGDQEKQPSLKITMNYMKLCNMKRNMMEK